METTLETTLETAHVTLEDLGPTSGWAGLVSALTGHPGPSRQRFVACQDGRRVCAGPTFVTSGGLRPVPSQDAWTPAMTRSFHAVCDHLERDGWARTGAGVVPWALVYGRPRPVPRAPVPSTV